MQENRWQAAILYALYIFSKSTYLFHKLLRFWRLWQRCMSNWCELYLPLIIPQTQWLRCSKQGQPNFLERAENKIPYILLTDPNWALKVVAHPFRITSEVKLNNFWHTHPNCPPFCFGRYFRFFSNFWMFFEYFDPYLALYSELRVQIWHT